MDPYNDAVRQFGQEYVDQWLDRAAVHFTGDLKPLPEPTDAELDAMVDDEMKFAAERDPIFSVPKWYIVQQVKKAQARMTARDELIAEARRAVLTPYCSSLSGARRSTKRDAVEAAFPYAMEWALDSDGDVVLDYYRDRGDCERKMYDYVYRRMTSTLTWLLLWWLVRGAVWRLVVALVAWLLTRETEA